MPLLIIPGGVSRVKRRGTVGEECERVPLDEDGNNISIVLWSGSNFQTLIGLSALVDPLDWPMLTIKSAVHADLKLHDVVRKEAVGVV